MNDNIHVSCESQPFFGLSIQETNLVVEFCEDWYLDIPTFTLSHRRNEPNSVHQETKLRSLYQDDLDPLQNHTDFFTIGWVGHQSRINVFRLGNQLTRPQSNTIV